MTGRGLVWWCALAASCASALSVAVTSTRPGLTFTDSETLGLRVGVADAPAAANVKWSAEETEGPWRGQGELTVPVAGGKGQAPLKLKLPGRGLFPLRLSARCGDAVATCNTAIAVVFAPSPPDPASPFGIFYTPRQWAQPPYPGDDAAAAALSHRLLGASWSRLNWWAGSFGKIALAQREGKPYVTGDWTDWKRYAKALRAEGISILGEIAQCPTELSSQPDAHAVRGDAGELRQRVKPRDYAAWDSLMENLARDFRDEIQYWEVWNEANIVGCYWSGTPEELVELVHHTAVALKRGNPKAKVMGCGWVPDTAYVDKVLGLGLGRDLDILSVHYTDESPGMVARWRALLKEHGLDLPLWNTEERSEIPLQNLAEGIIHSFKFMHLNVGYDDFRLLVNPDFTCRPPAVWHSVGAHFLGDAKYLGPADAGPGRRGYLFARGDERLCAISGNPLQSLFRAGPAHAVVEAEPLTAGGTLQATNRLGRTWPVPLRDGQARVALEGGIVFISGARELRLVEVEEATGAGLSAEAEDGTCSAGWGRNPHPGVSGGRLLELWSDTEPGPEGYWAEVKLTVPKAGRYEVIFAGNALTRLKPPCSLSPFAWRIDGGEEHVTDQATAMVPDVTGAPEGLSILGEVELTAGEHTFRLRLTGRRDEPDQHYALWFDAVALRPAAPRSAP